MGFLIKVIAAVSLWSNADHRRSEVLSECTFYGIGMTMIGGWLRSSCLRNFSETLDSFSNRCSVHLAPISAYDQVNCAICCS
jgi:hypothetical protein